MMQLKESFVGQGQNNLQYYIPGYDDKPIFRITSPSKTIDLPIPTHHGTPKGGLLLTANMGPVKGQAVCDLGTGYFALNAVAAHLEGASCAVGIEANPEVAIWASKSVADANLGNVHIIQGNDLTNIPERFDVILGNLPIMPTNDAEPKNIYMFGGKTGWEIVVNYLKQIPLHLNKHGYVKLLLFEFMGIEDRTSENIPSAFELLMNSGLIPRIIAKHSFKLENDHPLNTDHELATYIRDMYKGYNFGTQLTKVIVEGSLR